LWTATSELLGQLVKYRKIIEQRVNEAKTQGLRPDGGQLLREVKAYLEGNLGIPVGSFDVECRLPAKGKEVVLEVGKLLALCPKEGMATRTQLYTASHVHYFDPCLFEGRYHYYGLHDIPCCALQTKTLREGPIQAMD